jgi:SAM-dependent methyltransferase
VNPDFLPLLRCPASGSNLRLEARSTSKSGSVIEGDLVSETGVRWPIRDAVPRFILADDGRVESFGLEWHRWARTQFESENVGGPMAGHTTRMWEQICDPPTSLAGMTIVDFGCGAGRFVDVARSRGARVVGIELSSAADVARRNFHDDLDVLIVQGDVLRPPFAPGAFDGGFSIGVLHHTPDPAAGLAALAGAIRDGGWVACCVYPKGEFYDYTSVARMRWLQQRTRKAVGFRFASAYAHLAAYVLAPVLGRARVVPGVRTVVDHLATDWLPFLEIPDPRWRVLDMFDAVSPSIATTHDPDELEAWFAAAGCTDLRWTPWCSTSAVAAVRR